MNVSFAVSRTGGWLVEVGSRVASSSARIGPRSRPSERAIRFQHQHGPADDAAEEQFERAWCFAGAVVVAGRFGGIVGDQILLIVVFAAVIFV
jgi:hypothetical protein